MEFMQQNIDANKSQSKVSTSLAYVRVFLYMALGLAISCGISIGLPYLFLYLMSANPSAASGIYTTWIVILAISSFAQFILIFLVNSKAIRGKSVGTWVSYLLYAVCMGILMSVFFMFGDLGIALPTFATAFGITCLAFLVMALIGFLTKGNLNIFANIGLGLLFGGMMLVFVNYMLMLFMPASYGVWTWMDWVITFVMLIAILLITAYDMNRFKNDLNAGAIQTDSLFVYYAFSFYCDFIYILIRIFVVLLASRR